MSGKRQRVLTTLKKANEKERKKTEKRKEEKQKRENWRKREKLFSMEKKIRRGKA